MLAIQGFDVRAQSTLSGAFETRHFGPEEYDGHIQNWAITQDEREFIYVANSWGVLEFDGVAWRRINPELSGNVFSLDVGRDRIFVGGQDQLGFLSPDSGGGWQYHSLVDQVDSTRLPVGRISKTRAVSRGAFFQAEKDLFYWDGTALKPIAFDRDVGTSFLLNDTLYVAFKSGGLAFLADELPIHVQLEKSLERVEIVNGRLLPSGDVLLLTRAGLYQCSGRGFDTCIILSGTSRSILAASQIRDLEILNNGWIAVATSDKGILFFDVTGQLVRTLDTDQGLASMDVKDLHVDRRGGLWASLGNGISRINPDLALTYYTDVQGFRGKVVVSMLRFQERLYLATDNGLFYLSQPASDKMGVLTRVGGMSGMCYRLTKTDQEVFAGCSDGVYRVGEQASQKIIDLSGMPTSVFVSPYNSDRLYIGVSNGLLVASRTNNTWSVSQPVDGAPEQIVMYHQEDTQTIWLGTYGRGLGRMHLDDRGFPVRVDHYGETQGLPTGLVVPFDLDGRTVFALGEGASGLYRYTQNPDLSLSFEEDEAFSKAFNESGQEAVWVQRDDRGHYWIAGNAKMVEMVPRGNGTYDWNERPALQRKMNRHKLVSIHVDHSGILWSSWVNQLVRYDPSMPSTVDYDTPVSIRSVRARDRVLFAGNDHGGLRPLQVDYDEGQVRIDYVASDFSAIGGTQYRSRLLDLEEVWSGWTDGTYREYTNLSAGTYTFEVEARNLFGKVSDRTSISFTVSPAWYQTPWAFFLWITLGGFGLASLMHGYNRVRSRRLEVRNAELEVEVDARTGQIQEKQKELEIANVALNQLNDRLRQAYRDTGEKNKALKKNNQELLMTNKALNDRSEELREALEENKEILGITAHDLKNPLSGIIGITEIMLYDAQSLDVKSFREEATINARMMKDQAEMMFQIIKDLLDRYRMGDKTDLRFQRANLSDLVESVLPWNHRRANEKNIRIHFEPVKDMTVDVDVSSIQRVLDNLVSNAVKYNYPGRNIYVSLERMDEKIRFTVRDEGQGLTEDDKKRVFGKLQRLSAKPTGGEYSTGLGLYIVKQLVEYHEGRVGVESEHGKGATFWFELPTSVTSVFFDA